MSDAAAGPLDTGPPRAHSAISAELVRTLLAAQHPDLAHLEVGERFDGWDMAVFRLGPDLSVRLPRVEGAVGPLELEAQLIENHGAGWAFPHPHVVRTGRPQGDYPWEWSVVAWLPGRTTDREPLPASAAVELGRAVASIHRPATPDAPYNPEQSLTLRERNADVEDAWATLRSRPSWPSVAGVTLDDQAARAMWETALAAPGPLDAVWSHADLHGSNVLARHDGLGGIIDWGKAAACDRAVDLGFLYTVLPVGEVEPGEAVQAGAAVARAVAAYCDATNTNDPGLWPRLQGIALAKALRWATLDRELNLLMAGRALRALGVAQAS